MTNYFGTDGIRAKVGTEPMTPETVMRFGWAAGIVVSQERGNTTVPPKALIGKDTRISGYMFESALEVGLSAAGVDVCLLGPLPTPGVACLTRALRADIGFVISASHNPHSDNGVKLFTSQGTKFTRSDEEKISVLMDRPIKTSESLGRAYRITDAAGRYAEFCKNTLAPDVNLQGLHIALDCANGASYSVAPRVLSELGGRISAIGVSPNGTNINKEVGTMHPESLQRQVLESGADLGIALDGDGDRVILVDHEGEIVDGDEILMILADYYQSKGGLAGVVGTQMSNLSLEYELQQRGIAFERVQVGDRYILERLLKNKWNLGGETSGHIICFDKLPTGDGIIAALTVIDALLTKQQRLADVKKMIKKYPQKIINIPLKQSLDIETPAIRAVQEKAEKALGASGRVLIRVSGTEPLMRVMVEAREEKDCIYWVQEISQAIQRL